MQWCRKAAEIGHINASMSLARAMYIDQPYAREVGHVGEDAVLATPAEAMEGHDVPPDVFTSVIHWLLKGCATGQADPNVSLDTLRRVALEGGKYCSNDGCEVVGHPKDFKVCPQCKTARYCGAECQKEDWTTGGHKATCGTHWQNHSTKMSAPAQGTG